MEENNKIQYLSWQIEEYDKHERNKYWYIIASLAWLLMIFFSFFTITFSPLSLNFLAYNSNFLFVFILVLFAIITIFNESHDPRMVDFRLGPEGVNIGHHFYDYDELKNFSVIFKPTIETRNLYLEFNNSIRHRLSVPLNGQDPIIVRQYLLRYLKENLDRTQPPVSEQLTKMLKL